MSSLWKHNISISLFGESHGPAIGVVMDNLPPGESLNMESLMQFMGRRAPSNQAHSTKRREKDFPQIMSGLHNNRTTGTPLCAFIQNTDMHSADYSNLAKLARPGHADYTGAVRYKGFGDVRGGGHFSGRITAPMTFAGAVCGQILERRGIYTAAHIQELHGVKDTPFRDIGQTREELIALRTKAFPVMNDEQGALMTAEIERARDSSDSVGGIIECMTINMPAGVGSPMFDGLENSIAQLIFGIPAVKGLEFGAGFRVAMMTGSQNNDPFYLDERGHVLTSSNNHGGILGGISSGMPIMLRVAIKPTASIAKPQQTVDIVDMKEETLVVKGRHDPCILPRAVPVVEAAVNIALLSHMLDYPNF